MRIAILDPAAGISGDMLLGALVGAGVGEDWLAGLPARVGVPHVRVRLKAVETLRSLSPASLGPAASTACSAGMNSTDCFPVPERRMYHHSPALSAVPRRA